MTPASLAQERIWRLCTSPETSAGYTIAAAQHVRGPLDVRMMKRSIEHLMARHEALRTTFHERDGMLFQIVHPPPEIEIPVIDASGAGDPLARADALLRELAAPEFDMQRGPLLREQIVRLGEDEYRIHRAHHHIISDGGSWAMFYNELGVVYDGLLAGEQAPLGAPLPLSCGELAVRERERMRPGGRRHRELLARWGELADVEATSPPFSRTVPTTGVSPAEGTISWILAPASTDGLERLRAATDATYYTLRLGVFAALLGVEAGAEEVLFGTYVSTRRQPETQRMFGCFTHLVPLRLSVPGDVAVGEWLASVRDAVLEVKEIADLPYEAVAEELGARGIELPAIRALFALYEPLPSLRYGGMEVDAAQPLLDRCMPSGFSFVVNRTPQGELFRVDFDANVYEPAAVHAFIERYQRVAAQLAEDSGRSMGEILERSAAVCTGRAHGAAR